MGLNSNMLARCRGDASGIDCVVQGWILGGVWRITCSSLFFNSNGFIPISPNSFPIHSQCAPALTALAEGLVQDDEE